MRFSRAVARSSECPYISLDEPFFRHRRSSGSLVTVGSCVLTKWSAGMADLVERLTELQHRILELRDFL